MRKILRIFDSFFLRVLLAYALLAIVGYSLGHSQPPAWLGRGNSSVSLPAVVGEPANPQAGNNVVISKPKIITKVLHDTITVLRTDTIVKYDTLLPPKPIYYNYTIYYEILDRKFAMQKNFLWDYSNTSQKTYLQSSDTTLLSLGKETLREASYSYDDSGHKMQTFEKIIDGLDMRVVGSSVNITYRVDKSLLQLNGTFDKFGLLQLSSDFSRRRYFFNLVPIDFLFGSEKCTLFLRVEKSEVK